MHYARTSVAASRKTCGSPDWPATRRRKSLNSARSLSALSMLLGWKPYLMGERPSGVDATAFAALAGLLTPFFDSPLRQHALEFSNLVAYVDRMMARY